MNWLDLAFYLQIYSFLGWCTEVLYYAVTRRKFCNRGVVALPLVLAVAFSPPPSCCPTERPLT